MKTFSGFEASYAPCKYKTISYIRVKLVVVLKWSPVADSVTVAPLADVFRQFYTSLARLQIVILGDLFVTRLTFSNVMP